MDQDDAIRRLASNAPSEAWAVFMAFMIFTVAKTSNSDGFREELREGAQRLMELMPGLKDDVRRNVEEMLDVFDREVADTVRGNARLLSAIYPEIPWMDYLAGGEFKWGPVE